MYIAAGTAAQQLDATFSSNAQLEIYAIDMADTAMVAKSAGKVETTNRWVFKNYELPNAAILNV